MRNALIVTAVTLFIAVSSGTALAGDDGAGPSGPPILPLERTRGLDSNLSDWVTLPPMYSPTSFAVAGSWDDSFCVFGGFLGGSMAGDGVECFDAVTGLWSVLMPMAEPRGQGALAVVDGKFLIFGGGLDNLGASLLYTEMYDPLNDSWDYFPELPEYSIGLAAASVGGEAYAIGGYNISVEPPFGDVFRFNLSSGAWVSVPPMSTPRYGLGAAAVGGRIYAIGGMVSPAQVADHEFTAVVEEFDPATGIWRNKSPMPAKIALFATLVVGDKILVIGGVGENRVPLSSILAYDPAADVWASAGRMPTPRVGPAAAYANGTLYVTGGEGRFYDGNDVYAPGPAEWQHGSSMSVPRSDLGAAMVGGRILTFGGLSGGFGGSASEPVNVTEVYDPVSLSWFSKEPMPTARYGFGTAGIGDEIFTIAGCDAVAATDVVEVYNATSDSWRSAASFPTASKGIAAATSGARVYVVDRNRTYSFDPAAGSWSDVSPILHTRNDSALVSSGGLLYAVGGWDSDGSDVFFVSAVDVYSPANDSWWTVAHLPTPRAGLTAVVLDGRLYAIGGTYVWPPTATDLVEIFDIAGGAWESGDPMLSPRVDFGAEVVGQSIYVFGGERGDYGAFEQTEATGRFAPLPPTFSLTAVFDRAEIPPGETATLTVYFNNTDKPARSVELRRTFSVPVETSDESSSLADGTRASNGTWIFPMVPAGSHHISLKLRSPSGMRESANLEVSFVLEFSSYLGGQRRSVQKTQSVLLLAPAQGGISYLVPVIGIASALAVGSMTAYFGSEHSRLALIVPFLPLWTKLRHEEILDNEKRGMIRGYLAANPGANFTSIKEDLHMATGSLVHHLNVMEKEGLIKSWNDARFRRFALAEHVIAKAEPKLTEIEILLLEVIWKNANITQGELARIVGVSQPAVSYHLTKLAMIGIVGSERRGFRKRYFVTDHGEPVMRAGLEQAQQHSP